MIKLVYINVENKKPDIWIVGELILGFNWKEIAFNFLCPVWCMMIDVIQVRFLVPLTWPMRPCSGHWNCCQNSKALWKAIGVGSCFDSWLSIKFESNLLSKRNPEAMCGMTQFLEWQLSNLVRSRQILTDNSVNLKKK